MTSTLHWQHSIFCACGNTEVFELLLWTVTGDEEEITKKSEIEKKL